MKVEALFSRHIRNLEPYQPPDWEALAARADILPNQLIRLDANENPYAPSPRVIEALAQFKGYGLYPDYRGLEAAVACYAGVESKNIVLGNGGDEIIDLVVRLFVAPGEGVVVCPPAFGMYSVSTRAHRGLVLDVPRREDFSLDVERIESLVASPETNIRPKLLFVTTPGNPDGLTIPTETIQRLLRLPLAVVVDEAYIEFGGESAVPLLDAYPNLVVLRTFSKWASMAGLRLGYAVTSARVARAMARLRPPYNLNVAAVVAAQANLADMDHVQATLGRIVAERERLHAGLTDLPGVKPLPSQANFVFFRLDGRSGQEVADTLAKRGILVRSFSEPSLIDALRVTVGLPEQNNTLLVALHDALGGELDTKETIPALATDAKAPRGGASRVGEIHRRTRETDIAVTLDLDGTGHYEVDTGLGFLDHLLAQVASHGLFDLVVRARGDLEVDEHHTVEDVAIGLGQALAAALGERQGIVRMGQAYAPLDEALAHVVVDLSGRPYAVIDVEFSTSRIGALDADLIIHFLETLALRAQMSLHARLLYGRNDHHKAESLFKALGRALDAATRLDPRRRGIPSTKGVL
jgi:histidinol-phosphate aminotransferase